jgi:TusA-related sulfurtransferase
MPADFANSVFTAAALLDLSKTGSDAGATCAWLTPTINTRLRELASGQVLEVRVADVTAREDILSWSRLSGHAVLGMFADESQVLRFYLRKK